MKGFERQDPWLSLCGLNCGLCPMKLDGHCPGCGGGAGNQACAIARCSLEHGKIEYCSQCGEFPCARYTTEPEYDSFITYRHRMRDLKRADEMGRAAYGREQAQRAQILKKLLNDYNDGRHKSFFCLAANLLEFGRLERAMEKLEGDLQTAVLTAKDRAAYAGQILKDAAGEEREMLKLRRKKAGQ